MNAAGPTAGPAHSAFELRESFSDTDTPRLGFFAGDDPADPLVPRERRNVFPQRSYFRGRNNGLSQILRHLVYDATGKRLFDHVWHFTKSLMPAGNRSSFPSTKFL